MVATFSNAMFVTARAGWGAELARVDIAPRFVPPFPIYTTVVNASGLSGMSKN